MCFFDVNSSPETNDLHQTCMTLFLLLIFLACVFLVFYTYVGFPWLLSVLAGNKKFQFAPSTSKPEVSILIAAYNEEKVIREKIESIFKSNYPANKIRVVVGSDNSTDATNAIVQAIAEQNKNVKLIAFTQRTGKPVIINSLMKDVDSDLVILTDANVYFTEETIACLVRHFADAKMGLVGGNILNIGMREDGISIQEKSYIQRENLIKYREGLLWGTMMGPFGGCYMIRKEVYHEVPAGSLVDDFYISMKVLQQGFKCVNDLDAICYEDVPNEVKEEFRRKARISAGNFQNLARFRSFVLHPFTSVGFCFISHKFLRWITPVFLFFSFISAVLLIPYHPIFIVLAAGELFLFLMPLWDQMLHQLGIHLKVVRFISYFVSMNIALVKGYIHYRSGVASGVWEPTKR